MYIHVHVCLIDLVRMMVISEVGEKMGGGGVFVTESSSNIIEIGDVAQKQPSLSNRNLSTQKKNFNVYDKTR